jgi:hypothetical protein
LELRFNLILVICSIKDYSLIIADGSQANNAAEIQALGPLDDPMLIGKDSLHENQNQGTTSR